MKVNVMRIKIVCDSSANVSKMSDAICESVPLKIICGDREFVDSPALDVQDMVDYLKQAKARSSTSCPNVQDWLNAFEGADEVYAVTITSNLSGAFSSCMQAAEEFRKSNPLSRVHVFDSLSTGPEMHLIMEKIREHVLARLPFEQIKEKVTEYMQRTHLLFSLESLTNLARNGRVSPAVAKVCEVLGIRVVGAASDVGTLQPLHKVRGEKKALSALMSEILSRGYQGGKVRIAHCMNELSATSLAAMIREKFPASNIEIRPCGGLCSFYAEKGGLLVGFEG
ncbi:MAG: DegV family protein [Clostridiales bacterium]|nr:DegV family protein [Clostridiales bacterium]